MTSKRNADIPFNVNLNVNVNICIHFTPGHTTGLDPGVTLAQLKNEVWVGSIPNFNFLA